MVSTSGTVNPCRGARAWILWLLRRWRAEVRACRESRLAVPPSSSDSHEDRRPRPHHDATASGGGRPGSSGRSRESISVRAGTTPISLMYRV